MTSLLRLTGVTKSFAGVMALNAVSFDIQPGSALGVLGPNGCGRTVLIDLISGHLPSDQGRIKLADQDGGHIELDSLPAHEIIELGVARTWQDVRLIGGMTVLDEVMLGAFSRRRSSLLGAMLGLPAPRRDLAVGRDRARQMLELVGLGERAASLSERLSRGEQMRIGIARALTSQPDLLLLDAPAAGLAEAEIAELGALVELLRDASISVMVADRSLKLIAQCCDCAIALDAGLVIATGSPAECFASPAVQQAYFGTGATC
jgi:branched-chain amino acid transport system ATP-binding protein